MSKLIHVEQSAPGAKEAKTLGELFDDAQQGMRRVVALGLFAHEIKSRLKHGQFGPWLKDHAPRFSREVNGRPAASCQLLAYMELASGVLESCGFKLKEFTDLANCGSSAISHGGEILTLPDNKVPEEARPMREKICALIDGKTQRQLFAEFKTAEDDGDDLKVGSPLGKHHARKAKKPTPEEQLKARREQAIAMAECIEADIRNFLDSEAPGDLPPKQWQRLMAVNVECSKTGARISKAEKQARKRKPGSHTPLHNNAPSKQLQSR